MQDADALALFLDIKSRCACFGMHEFVPSLFRSFSTTSAQEVQILIPLRTEALLFLRICINVYTYSQPM